MGGMNEVINIWLAIAVIIVGFWVLFKIIKWSFTYRVNRLLIELHPNIMGSSRAEMKDIKEALDKCRPFANPKYIKTAEMLLDMNENFLKAKERRDNAV